MPTTRPLSLKGPTLFIAIVYAAIVAYVLWMHFKNYTGSPLALLVPAALALVAGFVDRRSPVYSAALLCIAAFCIAIADIVREVWAGQLSLYEMPLAGAGAAIWFASAVFHPDLSVGRDRQMVAVHPLPALNRDHRDCTVAREN